MSALAPVVEAVQLASQSVRTERLRSSLAIGGIVIGIVTVVLMASILANVRNGIALLFRELGTDNVFAYHLSGDPYQAPSEAEANRKALDPRFAKEIERLSGSVRAVGVQILVPNVINGRALTASAGSNESDTVLVEGASANYFGVVGGRVPGRTALHRPGRSGCGSRGDSWSQPGQGPLWHRLANRQDIDAWWREIFCGRAACGPPRQFLR